MGAVGLGLLLPHRQLRLDRLDDRLAQLECRPPVRRGHAHHGREVADLEVAEADRAVVAERVADKLRAEPIEDLRIDFEDGFGDQGDEAEDAAAVAAADALAADVAAGTAPPFVGIRFKCFEAPTRRRGIRTLDLFVTALAAHGELPAGLILTLPKVTTVEQVETMVTLVEQLEAFTTIQGSLVGDPVLWMNGTDHLLPQAHRALRTRRCG